MLGVSYASLRSTTAFVHRIGHMMHFISPLKQPTHDCWFSYVPVGRNKVANVVSTMCKLAGIWTNHYPWATAATRLLPWGRWAVSDGTYWPPKYWRSLELQEDIQWAAGGSFWYSQFMQTILYRAPTVAMSPCTINILSLSDCYQHLTLTWSTYHLIFFTARSTDHASTFYFSSCSNFTINFKNMELELELSIYPYRSCHNKF